MDLATVQIGHRDDLVFLVFWCLCVQLGAYLVLFCGAEADAAYAPLSTFEPFMPFRDPTCGISTYRLTALDCIRVRNFVIFTYATILFLNQLLQWSAQHLLHVGMGTEMWVRLFWKRTVQAGSTSTTSTSRSTSTLSRWLSSTKFFDFVFVIAGWDYW